MNEFDFSIRRAVPADAEALAVLAVRTFRATFEADCRPSDIAAYLDQSYSPVQLLAEITSPNIVTLLAISNGPVGFAQLRHGPVPECVTTPSAIELWRLYVDQNWHGKGVASQLMATVLREAVAAEAAVVWLGVSAQNERAVAFYSKSGFIDIGTHEFHLGEDVQIDRVMARAIENFLVSGEVP